MGEQPNQTDKIVVRSALTIYPYSLGNGFLLFSFLLSVVRADPSPGLPRPGSLFSLEIHVGFPPFRNPHSAPRISSKTPHFLFLSTLSLLLSLNPARPSTPEPRKSREVGKGVAVSLTLSR